MNNLHHNFGIKNGVQLSILKKIYYLKLNKFLDQNLFSFWGKYTRSEQT